MNKKSLKEKWDNDLKIISDLTMDIGEIDELMKKFVKKSNQFLDENGEDFTPLFTNQMFHPFGRAIIYANRFSEEMKETSGKLLVIGNKNQKKYKFLVGRKP